MLVTLAFFGEKLTGRKILRLVLGLSGVYILLGPSGTVEPVGVTLLIITIISYALYLLFVQWYMGDYPPRTASFYIDATIFIAMLFFGLGQGISIEAPPSEALIYIFLMAIVGTFLSRNLLLNAVKRIGSGQMSLLAPLDTMLTISWSILFLQETLAPIQWLGSLLVIISTALAIEKWPHLNILRRNRTIQ